MDTLALFIIALYGILVSYLEERFGAFQDLSPRIKQLVNSILAFIVPLVVNYLSPIWKPELGDASEVVNAIFILVVPAIVWIASQVAHGIDRQLQK